MKKKGMSSDLYQSFADWLFSFSFQIEVQRIQLNQEKFNQMELKPTQPKTPQPDPI